jgi:uncharacterized protein involved in response to NO
VAHPLALFGELPATHTRYALLAKGFRPFFLLAAAHAVLIVPAWLAVLYGVLRTGSYIDPVSWHAHEMVFGFAVAVISGFLLTAVSNWTHRETVVGDQLALLAGVWGAGRLALTFAEYLPRGVVAAVDLSFLPLLLLAMARPLIATRSRRNYVMLALVAALFLSNVAVHLEALGIAPLGTARRACAVAVDVVVLMVSVMLGRVLPMFTRNATGATSVRSVPALDVATGVGLALLVAADALAADGRIGAVVAGGVGALLVARAWNWGARSARKVPLLSILHASHGWLVVGLGLRAVAGFLPSVPTSLAVHALTIGVIGSATLGMMARVSLGHTGRPLALPSPMRVAFLALTLAAFARVFVPIVAPAWYFESLLVAGAAWSFAFATFLAVYLPILASPRRDGKPG